MQNRRTDRSVASAFDPHSIQLFELVNFISRFLLTWYYWVWHIYTFVFFADLSPKFHADVATVWPWWWHKCLVWSSLCDWNRHLVHGSIAFVENQTFILYSINVLKMFVQHIESLLVYLTDCPSVISYNGAPSIAILNMCSLYYFRSNFMTIISQDIWW